MENNAVQARRPVGRPREAYPIRMRNKPITTGLGPIQSTLLLTLKAREMTTPELVDFLQLDSTESRKLRQSLRLLCDRKLVRSDQIVSPVTNRWVKSWGLTRPGMIFVKEMEEAGNQDDAFA